MIPRLTIAKSPALPACLAAALLLPAALSSAQEAPTTNPLKREPVANPLKRQVKNPLAKSKADPFVGVYSNDEVTVTIQGTAVAFTGTVVQGSNTMPVTAKRDSDTLKGHFKFQKVEFPFAATLAGDVLTLVSAETTYKLRRQGSPPANPTPRDGATPPAPKPSASIGQVLGEGTTSAGFGPRMTSVRHRSGLALQYPESWTVRPLPQGITLIPNDVETTLSGAPLEVILVDRQPLDADSIRDKKVVNLLNRFVAANYTGFERRPEVTTIDSLLGPGAVYSYAGVRPNGLSGLVRIYAVMDGDQVVFLVHAGSAELERKRRPMALRIFASLGWGQAADDNRLPGRWLADRALLTANAADSPPQEEWNFQPGGDCTYTPPTSDAGQPAQSAHGRWTIVRKKLFIVWRDGSATPYQYRVDDHPKGGLRLTLSTGHGPEAVFRRPGRP